MTVDLLDRIADKIDFSDSGCWTWSAAKDERGYARVGVDGKNRRAHRVLYELVVEEIPKPLVCDHLCRNTSCVNPDHIEIVTESVNVKRGDLWQYKVTHCPTGHPYDEKNTYIVPKTGERSCRRCRADVSARIYARKRGRLS